MGQNVAPDAMEDPTRLLLIQNFHFELHNRPHFHLKHLAGANRGLASLLMTATNMQHLSARAKPDDGNAIRFNVVCTPINTIGFVGRPPVYAKQ